MISAVIVLGYIFLGGLTSRDLQRGVAVLPDRGGVFAAGVGGVAKCGRMDGLKAALPSSLYRMRGRG